MALPTGTPLQNNLEELFALLHFLEPVKFKVRHRCTRNRPQCWVCFTNACEAVHSVRSLPSSAVILPRAL